MDRLDAGSRPPESYKKQMSSMRFRIRSLILPYVEREGDQIYALQKRFRTKWLDLFFAWTANLGSHTFYVLMLPIPVWFGMGNFTRDIVIVLGLGIYVSGAVKDYLCLPRPKSPPSERITMSAYTSEEYGCPSSHSANATAATLVLLHHLIAGWSNRPVWASISLFLVYSSYCACLIAGRVYCGMHGFVDVGMGSLVGLSCYILRIALKPVWDGLVFSQSPIIPFVFVLLYYSLIYCHPVPIDACPCFDDSVAFVAVLLGLDLTCWGLSILKSVDSFDAISQQLLPYSFSQSGTLKSVQRMAIGVVLVALWKSLSKRVLIKMLKGLIPNEQVYKCFAYRPRYHVDILVKMVVYSGIVTTAIFSYVVFDQVGLKVIL